MSSVKSYYCNAIFSHSTNEEIDMLLEQWIVHQRTAPLIVKAKASCLSRIRSLVERWSSQPIFGILYFKYKYESFEHYEWDMARNANDIILLFITCPVW